MRATLVLTALLPVALAADLVGAQEPAEADPFAGAEEVTDVRAAGTDASQKAPAQLGAGEIVSRLHPALGQFPIAWLLLLALVDVLTFLGRRAALHSVGYPLALLALASFIPAAVTGLLRATFLPEGGTDDLLLTHRNLMLAAAVMLGVAVGLRVRARNKLQGAAQHAYLGFVLVAAALVGVGGHLGGKLVFGEHYLPF